MVLILRRTGPLDRPIDVLKQLRRARVSLRNAHRALNRLAEHGWCVCAVDVTTDLLELVRNLADMNVEVRRRHVASGQANLASVRARHGFSQRDFAALLGLDIRTLQNWEQARNRPDPAAASLAMMFDRAPELVEELMSEPIVP